MEKTFIEPWEVNETTHEFFVPDYINKLADKVLKHYDFSVKSMQVVTTKPDKGDVFGRLKRARDRKA